MSTLDNIYHTDMINDFKTTEESFVFSPYSVNFLMALLYNGMDGISKQEFETVFQPANNILKIYKEINNSLLNDGIKIVTSIYGEQSYLTAIKPEFMKHVKSVHAKLKICDFINNGENERKKINLVIKNDTNDLITELLQPNMITIDTCMILVNTIYLKMKWLHPFSESYNVNFKQLNNKSKQIKLMKMKKKININYFEDECIQAISLPYTGNYSMIISLPKNDFKSVNNIKNLIPKFKKELCHVKIPKFTTEFIIELNKIMKNAGLKSLFNNDCNLNMMMDNCNLNISTIVQKAKIIVDELGTEAAAATAIMLRKYCAGKSTDAKIFTADKTFQYYIIHDDSKSVLFTGVFNG